MLQSATAVSVTLGCGGDQTFRKNTLKKTAKRTHFGDLRAMLELAVEHLLDVCCVTDSHTEGDSSDIDGTDTEFLVIIYHCQYRYFKGESVMTFGHSLFDGT